jgi:hypothetical protein
MQRHRGFFLGLAMTLLLGFMGNPAQASTITLEVYLGSSPVFSETISGTGNVSVSGANSALSGSGYDITSLSVTADSSLVTTNGMVKLVGSAAPTAALTISVVERGLVGPPMTTGAVDSSASGNFNNLATGTATVTSYYQMSSLGTTTGTASGGTTGFSGSNPELPVGQLPSTYSLANSVTLMDLSKASTGTTHNVLFADAVILNTTAVPEPSSVVLLLTGMPLPMGIIFGLIRRRRARA